MSFSGLSLAQQTKLSTYNLVWTSPSENSSESMPCGGGDVGMNVWVENGDLLFYLSRSGTFDENNCMLKLGRVRVHLEPNPFVGDVFRQELQLENGLVSIEGENEGVKVKVKLWADVFRPVVHLEMESNKPVSAQAVYESWRTEDRELRKLESFGNSYKWAAPEGLHTKADVVGFEEEGVLFYHRNSGETIFDVTVRQQQMESVKSALVNPLENLTFGGFMTGKNMVPAGESNGRYLDTDFRGFALQSRKASRKHTVQIYMHTGQTETTEDWHKALKQTQRESVLAGKSAAEDSRKWWREFWDRSYISVEPEKGATNESWQVGRNYQLFRYMLACNAYGQYPTKFNGGLFTVDPVFTNKERAFTPDFRNWGGGTFTAQNQRLVYFPMLKSGDVDLMPAQFDFYLRILKNAELRSQVYWNHAGACFTEQIENFGLPNPSEYGWKRPEGIDPGRQYNAWLEYQYDTVLEFCFMILEAHRYAGTDIRQYLPLISSPLKFFDEHYQQLAFQRGSKMLNGEGKLVLFPGSSCETYKMAYDAVTTVAGLHKVVEALLAMPDDYSKEIDKTYLKELQRRIPELSFREIDGYQMIAPARVWERVNNTEVPQLYPVYPWGMYGVGLPDREVALNTWKYDPDAVKFRSHVGWKQDAIFAARLGLTHEADSLVTLKLKDAERRFPAFWGPGFDWVPDHNWGGSGMIALQEMLVQTVDDKIYLLPAWPKEKDVEFKLHLPDQTTIEVKWEQGQLERLEVWPETRRGDVVNCWEKHESLIPESIK